jgi:plasmid stabilization system protein ParE
VNQCHLVVEDIAYADMDEAVVFIAARNPDAAHRWLAGIERAILSLTNLPERCPLAPENEFFEEEIRELFYRKEPGRYRILFTIRGDEIHVLRVRHGARDTLRRSSESED